MICGGSGSSKFASSFAQYLSSDSTSDIGFISNVADNYWYHGLYVCPDVDIIMHSLSGQLDTSKGWGISSDTFDNQKVHSTLSNQKEWFSLGSLDSAYSQRRTELIRHGWRLSSIMKMFCERQGIKWPVIPATDDEMTTFVRTRMGLMHLQQYWVKYKAAFDPVEVVCQGQINARANPVSLDYLTHQVIICPANPITSISPTIGISDIRSKLKTSNVVAISPFVGDKVFSGPASKLMAVAGVEPNSLGVAKLYASFLKLLIIDAQEDNKLEDEISDIGIECYKTNIRIDPNNSRSFAKEIMGIL